MENNNEEIIEILNRIENSSKTDRKAIKILIFMVAVILTTLQLIILLR